MQTLTVVNRMLGTMGQKPLNSLTDSNAMLGAALDMLDDVSRKIQAKGWWFNIEEVTISPNVIDSYMYLPNDCLSIRNCSRYYVKRGDRIYNLQGGTYVFIADLKIELIRKLDFEDVPDLAADYISAQAVLQFQSDYDSDTNKRQELAQEVQRCFIEINTASIRDRRINMLTSNVKLQRLKNVTRGARWYTD